MSFTPKLQRLLLLRRAVRLVWQSAPGWTLASLVLLFVQGLLPLASLYLLKLIVDVVTAALNSSQPNFNHTLWLIVAMGAVTLAGALASSLAALVNVLDEPTSALDGAAEYEVFQQFRHLATRRTTILISHRISSARMADRIYMLANGRITEADSHVELMQQGGEYARLFELQAGNYH